jgi:predicted lipase
MPSAPFTLGQAIELGQFVAAAYKLLADGDPPTFAPPPGYALVTKLYADDITDDVPDYKVFGFIARSGADVVVAVRGTEGLWEWLHDFQFVLQRFPYADAGATEQGFTGLYSTLRTAPNTAAPRAITALADLCAAGGVQTVRITGHSLGGAVATMLAIDVAANNVFATPTVYTFASPMVGDKAFAGAYDQLIETSWRIVNLHDLVPRIPSVLAGYSHVDAEYPINSDDTTNHTLVCWHSLATYLHTLDPSAVPLDSGCTPA